MLPELCKVILVFYCFQKNMQLNFNHMVYGNLRPDNIYSYKKHQRHLIFPFLEDKGSVYLKSALQSDHEKSIIRTEDVENTEFLSKKIKRNKKKSPKRYGKKSRHKNAKSNADQIIKSKGARSKKWSYRRYSQITRDENEKLNAEEMIKSDGYGAETHIVHTDDGYVLTIHRILPVMKHKKAHRVMLHHGLLGSSEDWLLLGPGQALPYLLSDQGYDVWLLNARGNKYGREHLSNILQPNKFWKFSWHEMGLYDIPAVLRYIKKSTYRSVTHFIGHSMGATALLVLLSIKPEYNRELKSAVLLAPLAFMYHVQGPLKRLTEFHNHANISTLIDVNEFSINGLFPQILSDNFCRGHMDTICSNSLLLIADGGKDIHDIVLRKTILSHVPAGTSTRTIVHYLQLIRSGFFRMFDYGKLNNYKLYFSEEPPNYSLERITLPISLISSPSDWLATERDITTLVTKLQNVKVHHMVKYNDFNHLDFIWSKTAQALVFEPVINMLQM